MTGHLIASSAAKPLSDDECQQLLKSLREYFDVKKEPERAATAAEIGSMFR